MKWICHWQVPQINDEDDNNWKKKPWVTVEEVIRHLRTEHANEQKNLTMTMIRHTYISTGIMAKISLQSIYLIIPIKLTQ
jgi:hypothetical protein